MTMNLLFDYLSFGYPDAYDGWIRLANGLIFASCICLTFIFGRALYEDRRDYGPSFLTLNSTRHTLGKLIIFAFGGLARGWSVALLKARDWGFDTSWLEQTFPIHLVAAGFFVLGTAILIRLWTRTNLGWLIATFWTIIFGILVVVL